MPGLPPSASIQIPESSAIEKLFVFLETSLAFLIALSLNVSPSSSTSNDSGWSNNLQLIII